MKLYEVPRNSRIRIINDVVVADRYKEKNLVPNIDEVLSFKKIDGMYSLSYNSNNEPIHLAAWTEVEVLGPIGENNE